MNNENSNNIFIQTINKESQQIAKELIFTGNVEVFKNLNSIVVEIPNMATTSIGTPTGGIFGTYNPAELLSSDSIADAFSKVSLYLEKLTPASPPPLSAIILSLTDPIYTAFAAISPFQLIGNVVNNQFLQPSAITTQFGDASNGVLSAVVKNNAGPPSYQGSVALTNGNNTGVYGDFLEIVSDTTIDPFHNALVAKVGGTNVFGTFLPNNQEVYTMQLSHSLSGSTNVVSFMQDDAFASVPSVLFPNIISISGIISQVSGVNVYVSGNINCECIAINCVKKFYNSAWVGQVSSIHTSTDTALPTGADRNEGSSPNLQFTVAINTSNNYTNSLQLTFVVQNSASMTSAPVFATSQIYIDNVSLAASTSTFANEMERNKSGVGIYPPPSLDPYDPAESLTINYELQLINGRYLYPPAIDYTIYDPPSDDYSLLPSDGGYRYYTQLFDPIIDASYIEFTINNALGLSSMTIDTSTIMQISVLGMTGWLDANGIYPGIGVPLSNGDSALDYALSTNTTKRITFGGALYSGYVLIRIGITNVSGISFTGISMTYN
jgi:hypothetical protein